MFEGLLGGRYTLIQTLPQFERFFELASQQRALAVDTETSGLDWVKANVCGIVVGWGGEHNYYLPIDHKTDEKQLGIFDILGKLQSLFGHENKVYIFANAKFDLHHLRKLGIEVLGVVHDIVIQAHLLDEDADHGVKEMATQYLHKDAGKWEKRIDEWRVNEAKRRRQGFQSLVKELAAKLMADETWLATVPAEEFSVDAKFRKQLTTAGKKRAREQAKVTLAGHFLAKNKKTDISYDYIPLDEMTPYACADTHYTWLLFKLLVTQVAGHEDLKNLYINEMALLRVLLDTEHAGTKTDVGYLQTMEPKLVDEINRFEKEIYEAVGFTFNIDSDDQLVDALVKSGAKLTKLTKGSQDLLKNGQTEGLQYSVDKEVLEYLATKYPFAEKILEYRKLQKLLNTYVIGIRELVDSENFLHCDYNQNVSTGRMSSREPNLQNIPARNKTIRKAFIVPGSEWVFVFIDYSQIELRLTADRSQDTTLLSCYPFEGKSKDVHTITLADVVLAKPLEEVNAMKSDKTGHLENPDRGQSCECPACLYDFYRNIAKRVNFGIIYGAGPGAIQRQVSTPKRQVSKEECSEYIDRYLAKYYGVKEWINSTKYFMRKNGWVQNSFGRYRRLPNIRSMQKWEAERAARQGVNFLIQGEAADLFKVAAVRVSEIFRKHNARSRLVNFVHDELQFYWHREELHLLKEVKAAMEDFQYKVPIVAEISYSSTDWGAKKEIKLAA